jgi:UPF0271 protein
MTIDINCDMGESYGSNIVGNDQVVMQYISSANIACGFHGGDPMTMMKTIGLALKHGVAIGAHPGYADLEGFGRRPMNLTNEKLRASILYQVGALKSMTETLGGKLKHVKPHGAMYNSAAGSFEMSMIIANAVKEIDSSLILVCLSQSHMINAAKEVGIPYASEVFADRAYNNDGSLVSRNLPGAVIKDTKTMIERVLMMVSENIVESINGKLIPIQADTICIHGDNEMAPEFAKALTSALKNKGIEIKPLK